MVITPRKLVERFYDEVWNKADEAVARELLGPDFRFRGSLGPEIAGPDAFIGYMRSVHTALADYECVIEDLVESESRAAARMRFRGIHRGRFFGVPSTGRLIEWAGAAFFAFESGRISALWVLGDIDSVRRQLGAGSSAPFPT